MFQHYSTALEHRREKILQNLGSSYTMRMTSTKALDRKMRECIDPFDRIIAVAEPPSDGMNIPEALGLEQRLGSTVVARKSCLPGVERRKKDLKAIQEGILRVFGKVKTGNTRQDVLETCPTSTPPPFLPRYRSADDRFTRMASN